MQEYLKYWIWLSALAKISPRKRVQLIEHFGDPEVVWHAEKGELERLSFLNFQSLASLLDKTQRDSTLNHMEKLDELCIRPVTLNDRGYPPLLKTVYDPPVVLYVRGKLQPENRQVAVVGSRKASLYGLDMAEAISRELASCGVTVVSGMARGVDSQAHKGALKAGGRTLAVLGCGLDYVYPSENKDLMYKIEASGAVISEYIPGVPPKPINFPARNRIISGLSAGVVIIEAGERSGSLITAHFALDQGREVFAVPGNVNSSFSRGTNQLIKDGAKMVTSVEDILEELHAFENVKHDKKEQNGDILKQKLLQDLEPEERIIAGGLEEEPLHIDDLAQRCGLSIQSVNAFIVMLELKGVVEPLPGKIFRLKL